MVTNVIELMQHSGDKVWCGGGFDGMEMLLILGFLTLDHPF